MIIEPLSFESSSSVSFLSFDLVGRKPSKTNLLVSSPDIDNAVTAAHQSGGNSSQIFSGMNVIIKCLFAGKMLSTENNIIGEVCGNSLNPCWH